MRTFTLETPLNMMGGIKNLYLETHFRPGTPYLEPEKEPEEDSDDDSEDDIHVEIHSAAPTSFQIQTSRFLNSLLSKYSQ